MTVSEPHARRSRVWLGALALAIAFGLGAAWAESVESERFFGPDVVAFWICALGCVVAGAVALGLRLGDRR